MHGYNENTIKMDDLGGTPILGTPYLVQGSGILNGMFNTDEDFPKRTPFFLHGELYKKSPFVGDFSQPKSRSDILASKPVQVSHHDWESVTLAVLSDAWLRGPRELSQHRGCHQKRPRRVGVKIENVRMGQIMCSGFSGLAQMAGPLILAECHDVSTLQFPGPILGHTFFYDREWTSRSDRF